MLLFLIFLGLGCCYEFEFEIWGFVGVVEGGVEGLVLFNDRWCGKWFIVRVCYLV